MAVNQEAQARAKVWKYAFGYVKTSVIRSAVELEIPDILEKHGGVISLSELSSAVGCPSDALYRFMRFLTYHGIFKKTEAHQSESCNDEVDVLSVQYAQTPVSRLITRDNLGPMVLLQGTPNGPAGCVTAETLKVGKSGFGLESASSDDIFKHPIYGMNVFTDAMACHARSTTLAIIDNYPEGFEGIGSLVDVGGSYGVAVGMLVKAFPWIKGICFDLPEVVAKASPLQGIKFVGGSMFESVPKADAVLLMWVLHNWGDEECINILKKCKVALPQDTGKLIIVDAVIDEFGEEDEYTGARLALDMVMMGTFFKGKERTYREWAYILKEAGFRRHAVKDIKTIESVIVAYP